MRILKLSLANLNSLTGVWEIDFTHPDYVNEGLFAITGPTGAGKSTILDAICLGLYGQTPRLGRITKADNDIMSRQAGECWAEVSFATEQGQYRAYWYQHKARKAPDGGLQNARHELSELTSGRIIEEKLSLVPNAVTELSGLDFERFTRSVLLAQGQFAAFLHADDNQRSALLEQLTGTDIYAQISKRVYQRNKEEKEQLGQLKIRLGDIHLLSTAERTALEQQLEQLEATATEHEQAFERCQQAARWVERLQQLDVEIQHLEQDEQALTHHQTQFAAKQAALTADEAVRPLASDIRQHDRLDAELQTVCSSLTQTEQRFEELHMQLEAAVCALNAAQQRLEHARSARQQHEPLLDEASRLDQEIEFLRQREQELTQELQRVQHEHEHQTSAVSALKATLATTVTRLQELDVWIASHQEDQHLGDQIARLNAHIEQYQALEQHATVLAEQRRQLHTDYESLSRRPSSDEHRHQVEQLNQTLIELTETRDSVQSQLEQVRLAQRFAEQRTILHSGRPCPLCGASEHPMTQQPHTDESLAAQREALEDQMQTLTQRVATTQTQHNELAIQQAVNVQEQRMQLSALKQQGEQVQQAIDSTIQQRDQLVERWQPLLQRYLSAIKEPSEQVLLSLVQVLQQVYATFNQHMANRETLFQQSQRMTHQLSEQTRALQRNAADVERLTEQSIQHQQRLATQRAARQLLLEGKPTATVRKQLINALQSSEQGFSQATEQHQACKNQQLTLQRDIEHLTQRQRSLEQQLNQLRESLDTHVQRLGFANRELLQQALLDEATYRVYREQSQALQQQAQVLTTRRETLLNQRTEAQTKQPENPHHNAQQMRELKDTLNQLRQTQGALQQRLREDATAQHKYAAIQAQVEAQQLTQYDWSTLNEMIGSQDGKNYRNFAQGLTFAVMIDYANQKLSKMTDRYLLLHDHKHGLSLHVIDDYQGGEIRSTKNLSGGESFIVSLALALGLAQMASSRVRVDSLFLDEGFGTLDPETLEVALDTLASLRQEGKMIGLISHVGALQERIATQLVVVPGPGGHSRLEGPGVSTRAPDQA